MHGHYSSLATNLGASVPVFFFCRTYCVQNHFKKKHWRVPQHNTHLNHSPKHKPVELKACEKTVTLLSKLVSCLQILAC